MATIAMPAFAQIQQIERTEALMMATGREDPMPVVEERLTVDIDGEYAQTRLLQVVQNNTGGRVEGRYRLRAGTGSHVDGFAYWNGETKIVGEVFEKQLANQVYDRVTTQRRDPGLLQQDGEGAFSFKVFPIESQEKKRVEVHWTKWLDRRGKIVHFRAPVTRSDASIAITIAGNVKNVTSSTHRLDIEKISGGVRVRSEGARSAGEIQLDYEMDETDWQPDAYVQTAKGDNEGWFALSLAAPKDASAAVAAKDVTIVVDRSGSMTGEPMEHAQAAAADMVRMLNPKDRVNVIAFSDEVDPLFSQPHDADQKTKDQAIKFINGMHAGGGTDIAAALMSGIKAQEAKSENPKVIMFMTDGQSDAELAMNAAKGDTKDVRVFTIGLGKEVNKPLLSRLAAVKRGRFTYIENESSIEPEVRRLASSIAKPLLVDVEVDVEGATAMRLYPRTLPDLFAEDELLVSGRIRGKGTAKFIIKGKLAGKQVSYTRSVDLGKAPSRPWVGGLWAQSRIDHLLEEIALSNKDSDEMKKEVLELALAYNFVTPYTAFLAIPESELGAMKDTIENARAEKAKIMASNPDAAGLKNADKADPADLAASNIKIQGAAPTIDPTSTTQGAPPPQAMRTFASKESDDEEDGRMAKKDVADRDDDEGEEEADYAPRGAGSAPLAADGRVKQHGCAGCASTGGDAGVFVLVFVALVLRRRRRS
ncbi:MAG TPA: VIT and VWA domain-containing protein [Kofleriaceae bacterium]|nr:VIT and VWA domain-containing protein [Kofleriaceae bacterium]